MPEKSSLHEICGRSLFIISLIVLLTPSADGSYGDRSPIYKKCLQWCSANNCSNSTRLAEFEARRPWYLSFLLWECWDECEHFCMWHAVKLFQRSGQSVPQFHGKWPFYRFWGLQEPASFLFSILNGCVHYFTWQKFRKSVPKGPYSTVWDIQAVLSINAWFWSAVFHARDTPFTEKLDYFCAFSMVLYSFYSLCVRICSNSYSWMPIALAVPFLSFFCYHIHYLTYVRFDYGYNLKANIAIGLVNSCGWIMWCYKYRHKSYVWKCAVSVIIVNMLLLLELCDFPPWRFIIDAHALWHLGTIPVPLLWYRFLTDDCLFERKDKYYQMNEDQKVA